MNKNVFVMAHAFSDAPHVGGGLLFRDYYDWLVQTLIHLNNNNTVNCFVKTHPSSYMWNEKNVVEKIIERHQLHRICILPADFNTTSIGVLADVIITAKGTAGLEFSCLGIPAIIAGNSYYSGFNIAIEHDTLNQYFDSLDKVATFERLSDDRIKRAYILLYLVFTDLYRSAVLPKLNEYPGDDHKAILRDKYMEICKNLDRGETMRDSFFQRVQNDVTFDD